MTLPACWNRPPYARRRIRTAASSESVVLTNDWFTDRCATWDGTGIGPAGEPYPVAHGFAHHCRTCCWLPAAALDAAAAAAQHSGLTPATEPTR